MSTLVLLILLTAESLPSSFSSPSIEEGLCLSNHGQRVGTCVRAAGGDLGGERATLEPGEHEVPIIAVLLTVLQEYHPSAAVALSGGHVGIRATNSSHGERSVECRSRMYATTLSSYWRNKLLSSCL
jgi:hypothetical protein